MHNFKVTWLIKCSYPFRELDNLPGNHLNENLPIYKSFNGQEIPPELGNYLCHLLYYGGDASKGQKADKEATAAHDVYQRVILKHPEDIRVPKMSQLHQSQQHNRGNQNSGYGN